MFSDNSQVSSLVHYKEELLQELTRKLALGKPLIVENWVHTNCSIFFSWFDGIVVWHVLVIYNTN